MASPQGKVQSAGKASSLLMAQSLFNRFVGLGTSIILARILFPEDFGIVAVSFATVSIFSIVTELNVEKFVIAHSDKLAVKLFEIRSLRAKTKIISFVLVELAALTSLYVYPSGPYAFAIALHGLQLLIEAFYNLDIEIRKVDINFKTEAKLKLVTRIMTTIVAISMALLGFSFISLIVADLIASFTRSLISHASLGSRRPFRLFWQEFTAPFKQNQIKDGFYYESLIGAIRGKADTLVFSTAYQPSELGLFNYAKNLTSIPSYDLFQQITRVQFAYLRQHVDRIAPLLRDFIYYSFSFSALLYSGLIIFSSTIILILLGEHWLPMQPVFTAACLFFVLAPYHGGTQNTLIIDGHIKVVNYYEVFNLIARLFLLIYVSHNYDIVAAIYVQAGYGLFNVFTSSFLAYQLVRISPAKTLLPLLNGGAVLIAASLFDYQHVGTGLSPWELFFNGVLWFSAIMVSFIVIDTFVTKGGASQSFMSWAINYLKNRRGSDD